MIKVSVTELKARLSKYLRLVKAGETVEVMERSVPIARLAAVHHGGGDERLERLIATGVVTAPAEEPRTLHDVPLVPTTGDVVEALVEGRGER